MIMSPFKKVRRERQKPAHKIIDNTYDPSFEDKQKKIIEDCYISMGSLRRNIATHPRAKSVELPESIDLDDVKYF